MTKFFCISDIHSFYEPMINALNNAGFDPNNPEHILMVLGDVFDRGTDSEKVLNYLQGIERKILIKGNHETLLLECCERGYPERHDWHNGTSQTIIDLAPDTKTFEEACLIVYDKVKPFIDGMANYFETKNYVFTHGYVPYNKHRDWREADELAWEDARWNNGMEMVDWGWDIDKCVVVGHYHTSWGRAHFEDKPEWGEDANFSPFYYKDKLIAIDACTAYSKRVNCLVIEDDFI